MNDGDMRILIADDDPLSRALIETALRQLGHTWAAAADGAEAWAAYRANGADVLISDWRMPGIDGPELCRRIRDEPGGGAVYIVLLTALADEDHVLEAMRAGADDHLRKPLRTSELEARLIAADRVTKLHRELALATAALRAESRRDPLTGLGNRLQLHEDLRALAARRERYGHGYAVALCDVDHFKEYNDLAGHLAGDAALARIARVLRAECREGDGAYRYGGEEFLLLFPEQTCETALLAVERIRRAVEALEIRRPDGGVLTFSAGIAESSPAGADATLRLADRALYDAKGRGRNLAVAA